MDDDGKPLTFVRALTEAEFWLILVSTVAATLGVSAWVVVPLAVTGLSISSLPKYLALRRKARAVGAEGLWWETVALSMLNNMATASGAHLVGVITHWIWW